MILTATLAPIGMALLGSSAGALKINLDGGMLLESEDDRSQLR